MTKYRFIHQILFFFDKQFIHQILIKHLHQPYMLWACILWPCLNVFYFFLLKTNFVKLFFKLILKIQNKKNAKIICFKTILKLHKRKKYTWKIFLFSENKIYKSFDIKVFSVMLWYMQYNEIINNDTLKENKNEKKIKYIYYHSLNKILKNKLNILSSFINYW